MSADNNKECDICNRSGEINQFIGRVDESMENIKTDINSLFKGQREMRTDVTEIRLLLNTITGQLSIRTQNGRINWKGIGIMAGAAAAAIASYVGLRGGK